jgi:hypothetical protein
LLKNIVDVLCVQIRELREQYEARMQGLLPATLQRDLEDTIVALKSQVVSLQQRTALLQDELAYARALLGTTDVPSYGGAQSASMFGARSGSANANAFDFYRLPIPNASRPTVTKSETTTIIPPPSNATARCSSFGSMPRLDGVQSQAAGDSNAPHNRQ